MNWYNKRAFTFIELLVALVVLIIIWTIWFYTLVNNIEWARDSSKITALNNIKTTLVNYKLNNWLYPKPTNFIGITYSWATVWNQWTFWKNVSEKVDWSKEKILDTYTKNEYTYSITWNNWEFQISWVLEKTKKAIVLWDYNWRILNINILWVNNILAIPSIISNDLSNVDLNSIIYNNRFFYNNSNNLPSSYNSSIFNVNGWENLSANNLVVFSWSLSDFKFETNRITLLDNIKKSYEWTIVSLLWNKYFQNINIDLKNPSTKVLSLSCNIIEFDLNYPVECNNESFFAIPIFNLSLLNIDFSGLVSKSINTVFQDNNNNIWFWTDKGISVYNTVLSTWTTYTTSNWLVNNKVKIINQSSNGNIWIWTDKGISVYNPLLSSWTTYTISNWLVNKGVKLITHTSSWNTWIGTDKGISVFNPNLWNWTIYNTNNWLVNNNINTINQSSNGNIWIWTDKGISVYNPLLSSWTTYTTSNWLVNKEVKSITHTSSWTTWIATDKGISVFNSISWIWTPYVNNLVSTDVKNIFIDNNSNVWVATNKGVNMFNWTSWLVYSVTDWLISNKVKSIFQDINNDIWFITKKWLSKLSAGVFINYPNKNNPWIYVVYKSNWITVLWIN